MFARRNVVRVEVHALAPATALLAVQQWLLSLHEQLQQVWGWFWCGCVGDRVVWVLGVDVVLCAKRLGLLIVGVCMWVWVDVHTNTHTSPHTPLHTGYA